MKNVNKFLIYRPKKPTHLVINQMNQIFNDRTLRFLARKAFTKYILYDVSNLKVSCIDASVYIFRNLNLFLYVTVKKASCFKHQYNYVCHDYCCTRNKLIEYHG